MSAGVIPASKTAAPAVTGVTSISQAINFLTGKGLTHAQASGVVAVLDAESSVDPNALNPKEGAYGIAQWTQGRKAGLLSFAASKGKPANELGTQLEYLWSELQGPEAGSLKAVKATKTAQEAIHAWVTDFERPKSDTVVEKSAAAHLGQVTSNPNGTINPVEEVKGDINEATEAALSPLETFVEGFGTKVVLLLMGGVLIVYGLMVAVRPKGSGLSLPKVPLPVPIP